MNENHETTERIGPFTILATNRVGRRASGNRPGRFRIKRHSPRATPAIDHPLNIHRLLARAALKTLREQQAKRDAAKLSHPASQAA